MVSEPYTDRERNEGWPSLMVPGEYLYFLDTKIWSGEASQALSHFKSRVAKSQDRQGLEIKIGEEIKEAMKEK